MTERVKQFNAKDYLKRIDGKEHYDWEKNSIFKNKIPVSVVKEGIYGYLEMNRFISAVLLILKQKKMIIRDMVALPNATPLKIVLNEINNIIDYRLNILKEKTTEKIVALEAHLVPMEFYEDIVEYKFHLSEIFSSNDKDIGFFVELLRAAEHMKNHYTFMLLIPQEDINDIYGINWDSLRLYYMNLSASQLREVFRLLGDLSKKNSFKETINELSERGQSALKYLQKMNTDFENKTGFIKKVLAPYRNRVFHYDEDEAKKWGQERIEIERRSKYIHSSIILSDQIISSNYGLGSKFDENLLVKYVYFGTEKPFEALEIIKRCQEEYFYFVRAICEVIMKKHNINSDRTSEYFVKDIIELIK